MAHSRLATPGATAEVLRAHGLATRKSLGQHFLVDDNIVGRILSLADLSGTEPVLEVGPGIGTLTAALCEAAGAVVAVERDVRLAPVLAETTAACPHFTLVTADAVDVPMSALTTHLGPPTALVANLPYGVAATVVLRFFEHLPSLRFAVVMVQAEVADRMAAEPGSKQFGSYTVKLRLRAAPAGRFPVARTCFMPPPRVDSVVLRLERTQVVVDGEVITAACRIADAAFAQRRKTVRNSLRAALGADDAAVDQLLAAAGIDGVRRAETLGVTEYVEMGEIATKHALLP